MKNKVSDVRDYLVAMLERLGDDNLSAEDMGLVIERAKTSMLVATIYIGTVKVELDAIRLMDETGKLATAVGFPHQAPRCRRVEPDGPASTPTTAWHSGAVPSVSRARSIACARTCGVICGRKGTGCRRSLAHGDAPLRTSTTRSTCLIPSGPSTLMPRRCSFA